MDAVVARLRVIQQFLSSFQFHYSSEDSLQRGLYQALDMGPFAVKREYQLTPESRLDFLIDDSIALEVKIGGSAAEVMRQISRYAEHPQISGILLVTSRTHVLPSSFSGKPLATHYLLESAF